MDEDIGGVCIVTQPGEGQSQKTHARDLADIIAELTTVAILTANLAECSLLRENHEVVEFSTSSVGDTVLIEAIQYLRNQIRLCWTLRRREEAVVLFFGTTSYLLPIVAARLLGKRVAILPRGNIPLSLRLRWEEKLPDTVARLLAGSVSRLEAVGYRLAHGVITYTPQMAATLGLKRYEHKLYPMGARFIDTDRFDVDQPFAERGKTVGFLGRLEAEKRVPLLAEVAAELPEDIRMIFVGDGTYRETLERQLAEEIDAGQVEVVGWVEYDAVPAQLNRLQLLLLPSKTEGLPTTVLEAMACGTPAYATPVAGVPDVVRDGETGFLMETVDARLIADEITRILDCEELPRISHTSRELIENEYSFEAAVERYRTILVSLSSTD
jgi:glycosyltransferase involved in cell wall biosynthesis